MPKSTTTYIFERGGSVRAVAMDSETFRANYGDAAELVIRTANEAALADPARLRAAVNKLLARMEQDGRVEGA